MELSLAAYLPQDRRAALVRAESLPEHTHGAALFADIAGFTPLTEALDRALGARRGAEAMTEQLNQVYAPLIVAVERYGGSVIGFAGDSMTCWFGDHNQGRTTDDEGTQHVSNSSSFVLGSSSAARAVACALALQAAMRPFAAIALPDGTTIALALKVAVASGPARRFGVGDPAIQLLDALAGATLDRVAVGEHLAQPGEVLIDRPTADALGDIVQLAAWRSDAATGARFAVLTTTDHRRVITAGQHFRWSVVDDRLSGLLRPWLLRAVYDRHQAGLGEFLTELRPVVALFVRFAGIDYDADPDAGTKLDQFIQRVQAILARYDGTLIQLTIGDKGAYIYLAFGAPSSHEDDAQRAAHTALEIRLLPAALGFLQPLQIGMSRGVLRVGACGAPSRRAYAAMGDDVNLAARLMTQAAPGEIVISGRMQAALAAHFDLEPLEPIPLKGMPEPLPVFRLAGAALRTLRVTEPIYTLPMVGRIAELARIGAQLDRVLVGQGQVVGIVGEAGMGKSRLIAEVIRLARRQGLRVFGGACQSYGANTPYLVWASIWRGFFELDPTLPIRRQVRTLEGLVREWAPERMAAIPLLSRLLDLPLPENDFTRTLEPQFRRSALEALLLDCLCAAAREAQAEGAGLLLVLEDLHWIDALSHDLLEQVGRASTNLPMLIVLAYRPPELLRLQASHIEALAHFTRIDLGPLTDVEAAQTIRAKLAQLLPERKGSATPALIARITAKAQGNPFYVEELLNYLRDRGIDPQDAAAIASLDLPSSLHTLILSRIDQLSAQQQAILKVASVIGRLFRFAYLHGAFPVLGAPAPLKTDLDELATLDLTPLDTPEPELTYLFKHIVTQEVAYASLTAQARAGLHEQLAAYLERLAGDDTASFMDLLAFHYDRSNNLAKRRAYLRRAGEAAAARYANDAALDYFTRAFNLTPEDDAGERYDLLWARVQVLHIAGARSAEAQDLVALEALAAALDDNARRADVGIRRARYAEAIGAYAAGIASAQGALMQAHTAGSIHRAAAAGLVLGMLLFRHGDMVEADAQLAQAFVLAEQANCPEIAAECLEFRGNVADGLGHTQSFQDFQSQAYERYHAIGHRRGEGATLGNLGSVADIRGDYPTARHYYEKSTHIFHEIGDRRYEAYGHGNLGMVASKQGAYVAARVSYTLALRMIREVGDQEAECWMLDNLGTLARFLGDYASARITYAQSLDLARAIGDRRHEGWALTNAGFVAHYQNDDDSAYTTSQQAVRIAKSLRNRDIEGFSLTVAGHALVGLGRPAEAVAAYQAALAIRYAMGQPHMATELLAGLARVALSQGEISQALNHAEEILAYLTGGGIVDGTDEPFHVYLTCYQVLRAANDPRAHAVLERGHTRLQEQTAEITDAAMRRSFLENVPYHRELVAAWAEAQRSGESPDRNHAPHHQS